MKCQITATAPTHYQSQSLREFRIGCIENGNGSFSGKKTFKTIKEARQYLKDLAVDYYDNDRKAIAWHLGKNSLTLDGIRATISKIED